jgi:hypothetical protein
MYLRPALDRDMVVIGTLFAHTLGSPTERGLTPADTAGMYGLLSSLSVPAFIMDLHELAANGVLHDWFHMTHELRYNFHPANMMAAPLDAFDAILYIDTITPTPPAPKQ